MTFTLAGCLLLLYAGADPLNEAALKELKALEGDWVLQRIEAEGKKHEPDEGDKAQLTIKGKTWNFSSTGEKGEVVALDPTCNPKLIDLKTTNRQGKTFTREGIFKKDGDTLLISLKQGEDKKRPTNFDTPTEAGTVLFVFKRPKQ